MCSAKLSLSLYFVLFVSHNITLPCIFHLKFCSHHYQCIQTLAILHQMTHPHIGVFYSMSMTRWAEQNCHLLCFFIHLGLASSLDFLVHSTQFLLTMGTSSYIHSYLTNLPRNTSVCHTWQASHDACFGITIPFVFSFFLNSNHHVSLYFIDKIYYYLWNIDPGFIYNKKIHCMRYLHWLVGDYGIWKLWEFVGSTRDLSALDPSGWNKYGIEDNLNCTSTECQACKNLFLYQEKEERYQCTSSAFPGT